MSVIHPENDAPVDHMKIHKDVVWVIRTLWMGATVVIVAALWVAALAADVETNAKDIEDKAEVTTVVTIVETLKRIERKIDTQATEQRTVTETVIRLETKVEALEKKVE